MRKALLALVATFLLSSCGGVGPEYGVKDEIPPQAETRKDWYYSVPKPREKRDPNPPLPKNTYAKVPDRSSFSKGEITAKSSPTNFVKSYVSAIAAMEGPICASTRDDAKVESSYFGGWSSTDECKAVVKDQRVGMTWSNMKRVIKFTHVEDEPRPAGFWAVQMRYTVTESTNEGSRKIPLETFALIRQDAKKNWKIERIQSNELE